MVRTQVQLPDDLHRALKALAERKEWSLAEAMRRGAELLLHSYPDPTPRADWQLPGPFDLGGFTAGHEQWRELANERET